MNFNSIPALHDEKTIWLFGGVIAVLVVSTIVGQLLRLRGPSDTINNINARIRAWWIMSIIFAIALLTGGIGSVILFAFLSFFALREFITLTPTRPGDHRSERLRAGDGSPRTQRPVPGGSVHGARRGEGTARIGDAARAAVRAGKMTPASACRR